LRKNNVSSLEEIENLKDLKNLQYLFLSDNPISLIPNYRYHIIRILPHIRKLDSTEITEIEREEAFKIPQPVKENPREVTTGPIYEAITLLLPLLSAEDVNVLTQRIRAQKALKL